MFFLEIIKTVVLGIIQGITEWLPISSTGHMILFDQFVSLNQSADFIDMFFVVIQFGSILAVLTLYFNKLNPFSPKKSAIEKQETWTMWFKVLVGVIPVGIIGFLFDDLISEKLYNAIVVSLALIIYGIFFIVIESKNRKPKINTIAKLSYKTAILIGTCQVLALIPGTSRSGSTILGAVLLGCGREVAAEFSFFIAIPVMAGASGLKILKYFLDGNVFTSDQIIIMAVGLIVAYVVSVIAIKFLMSYIRKHDFKAFGYYRIIVGIIILLYFILSGASVIVR